MFMKRKLPARMAAALSILGLLAATDLGWSRGLPAKTVPAVLAKSSTVTTTATEYSGQATAINFTNIHMGPPFVIIGDTGQLPSSGGNIDISVDQTNMVGLSLDLATASTRGVDDAASSSVSLNNVSASIETLALTRHNITVDTITVDASATCTASGPVTDAHSTIQGLTVDGTAVEVTGEPNQIVDLGDASLVLNEQVLNTTSTSAAIGLVAIHVIDPGCLDGFIGLVHADITCKSVTPPPPTSQCDDFVTGGGWIVGPSGEKANFGVAGGIRKGALWGHLNYIDHGTGLHVKAQAVTDYEVIDAVTRQISYDVTIDGVAGTAVVRVSDNGEPGRNDTFEITLSNGYTAGGDLGGSQPGGGNIQLHLGKCGIDDCVHTCPKCGHKCHKHHHPKKPCNHVCDGRDHDCDHERSHEHKCDKCDHQCEHHDHRPDQCNHKCDRKDHDCKGDYVCEHKCDKCNHKCEHHDHRSDTCNHKCDRTDHKCSTGKGKSGGNGNNGTDDKDKNDPKAAIVNQGKGKGKSR